VSIEKYKKLFEYSQSAVKDEFERFKNTEQKASNYLSVLTLVLAGAGFFVNWVLERFVPPHNYIEWLLFSLSALILICIATAWYFLFSALGLTDLKVLRLDDEILEFFRQHEDVDVYYYMSQSLSEGLKKNRKTVQDKIAKLKVAYSIICFTVVLLVAFAGFYSYQRWQAPPVKEKNMAEQNTTEQPAASQPSADPQPQPSQPINQPADVSPTPGVTAPPMASATHSAPPPTVRDSGPAIKTGD
jgi:hypothetical protein